MTRSERYEVIEKVQYGAVAETFKARDRVLDRFVLLKVLHPRLAADSDLVQRFRREALVQARLKHPNIVTVYDFGSEQDFYIASEFIEGCTLADLLERAGRLTIDELRPIVLAVIEALRYSHAHGVVHRDLKPANIMISDKGDVRLADFGLAFCREMSQLTQEGCVIGTPAYMSPAQARGQTTDWRADIFSLGVVIYEALSGANPFQAESHADALSRILNLDPPPLSRIVPDVEPRVSRLVARMLAKDREEREDSLDSVRETFVNPSPELERRRTGPLLFPAAAAVLLSAFVAFLGLKLLTHRPRTDERGTLQQLLDSGLVSVSAREETFAAGRPPVAESNAALAPESGPRNPGFVAPEPSSPVPVRISVRPWAEVTIDGQPLGVTPLSRPALLEPGRHRALLKNPYFPDLTKSFEVSGESGELTIDLDDEFAFLDVVVKPWAEVALDGRVVDTTPLSRPIPAALGRHILTLRHPDLGESVQSIRADTAGEYRMSFDLMRN